MAVRLAEEHGKYIISLVEEGILFQTAKSYVGIAIKGLFNSSLCIKILVI